MAKFIIGVILMALGTFSTVVFKKIGFANAEAEVLSMLIVILGGLFQASAFMSEKTKQDRLNLEYRLMCLRRSMIINAIYNKKQSL